MFSRNQKLNPFLIFPLLFLPISFLLFPIFKLHSYIPKLSTILERTIENNGSSLYLIVQEVSFKKTKKKDSLSPSFFKSHQEKQTLTIQEKWLIKNENIMQLHFKGKPPYHEKIKGTYIYNANKRYFKTPSGGVQSLPKGIFWFEDFFHSRNPNQMLQKIKKQNILSSSDLIEISNFTKKRSSSLNTKEQNLSLPPQINLTRVGGVITYGIGKPSVPSLFFPGLWIEQDHFLIRKLRLLDQNQALFFEVKAENYKAHPKNLWLPRIRKIKSNQKEALVQVLSVQSVRATKKTLQSLSPKSLIDKRYHFSNYQWEEEDSTDEVENEEITQENYLKENQNELKEKLKKEEGLFQTEKKADLEEKSNSWIQEFYHQFR